MAYLTTFLWGIPAIASFFLLVLLIRSQDRFAAVTRTGWTRVLTGGVLFVIFCITLFLLHLPVVEFLLGPWVERVALGAYLLFAVGLLLVVPAMVGWLSEMSRLRNHSEERVSSVALIEDLLSLSEQGYVLTELLMAGLTSMLGHSKSQAGMIWLLAHDKVTLVLAGSTGFEKPAMKAAESIVASGQELFDRVLRGGQVVTAGDLGSRTRFLSTFPGMDAFGSVAVIPLSGGGSIVGVALLAADQTFHFTPVLANMLEGAGRVLGTAVSGQRLNKLLHKLETEVGTSRRTLKQWDQMMGGGMPAGTQSLLHGILDAAQASGAYLVPPGERYIPMATDTRYVGLPMDGIWSEAVSAAESKHRALWVNPGRGGTDPRNSVGRWVVVPTPAGFLFFAPKENNPAYTPGDLARLSRIAEIALLLAPAPEVPDTERVLDLAREMSADSGSPARLAEVTSELITDAEAVLVWHTTKGRLSIAAVQGCDIEPLEQLRLPAGQGTVGKAALAVQPLSVESQAELGRSWAEYSSEEREAFAEAFGGLEKPSAEYVLQIPRAGLVLQLVRFTRGGWSSETEGLVRAIVRAYMPATEARTDGGALTDDWKALANDLNNVFTGILGQAELLEQRLTEAGVPATEREGIERILKAAQSGGELVQKLSAAEETEPESGGLDRMAAEVLSGRHITDNLYLLPENRAIQIQTSLEPTPSVSADEQDRQSMQTVLWSALSAVAKSHSEITLGTSSDDRYLYLAVGSDGKGEPLKGPFGDFFRAPDLQWKDLLAPGELDFLRSVGGQIATDDVKMPGRLVIRLPYGKTPLPLGHAHPGLHVLAIDDQEIIRDLLLNMFMGMGHRIRVCKSGEEGLKFMQSESYDLVLTDLGMPGMSGWEVAQAVKIQSPNTPVVLITGWGFNFAEDQVRAAGVDYVLTKPFRLEHLTEIVDAAVSRSPQVH